MIGGADLESLEFNKYLGVLSDYLVRLYVKLGRPSADYKSDKFWIMIDELVNNWSLVYKEEASEFIKQIKLDRAVERSLPQSVSGGFKKYVAYPSSLYQMFKIFFPDIRLQDKKFTSKFIIRYPIFNASNYT